MFIGDPDRYLRIELDGLARPDLYLSDQPPPTQAFPPADGSDLDVAASEDRSDPGTAADRRNAFRFSGPGSETTALLTDALQTTWRVDANAAVPKLKDFLSKLPPEQILGGELIMTPSEAWQMPRRRPQIGRPRPPLYFAPSPQLSLLIPFFGTGTINVAGSSELPLTEGQVGLAKLNFRLKGQGIIIIRFLPPQTHLGPTFHTISSTPPNPQDSVTRISYASPVHALLCL